MFYYYVLNYDHNEQKIKLYNIFNNIYVQEYTEKAVKKYMRAPGKYKYCRYDEEPVYGFDALCKEIDSIIRWQEWGRFEYEIGVGYAFETDCDKLQKIDCYEQCKNNIPVIARECIWQYKHGGNNE